MNKKIIGLIIFVILFFGVVTIYKFGNKKEETKEHYFVSSEIKNFKSDDETDVNDKEKYGQYVINTDLTYIDYTFINNKESITGSVYIGSDKKLYITDTNKNIVHLVSPLKFKTIYFKDYQYDNGIYLTILSEDYKLYSMSLDTNDVRKTNIFEYRWAEKFTNFVDIDYKHDMYIPGNAIFAITDKGKIYNVNAGLRYDETVLSLYSNIYVFNDQTMTNSLGNVIENRNGEKYKIKNIFIIQKSNGFLNEDAMYAIITQDDRFIYMNSDVAFVYEFDKKVKDINFDSYYPYVNGNLKITFEDDYNIELTATCNEYYCINEFAE